MTIETPAAIAPGWYPDPAGSPQVRWWDGASWTDHLALSPVPESVPQPVAPAASATPVVERAYSFNGASSAQPLRFDPTAIRNSRGPISNRSAWTSLILGAFALTLVLVHLVAGQGGYIVTLSSITSIIWGIRALVRRSNGQSTNLWAPILGMLMGLTAATLSLLMLAGLFQPTGTAPAATVHTSTTGGAMVPYISAEARVFPNSPSLTSIESTAGSIAQKIQDKYAGGNDISTDPNAFPVAITAGSGSAVTLPDGEVVGQVPSGIKFQYIAENSGFALTFTDPSTSESVDYASYSSNHFTAQCLATDQTCQ
jgi:hypothetical protein